MAGPRGNMSTPIRAQTPPTGTNITASFVRGSIPPPRTPSPAGINQGNCLNYFFCIIKKTLIIFFLKFNFN